jgi:hypothetical protein
MSGGRVHAFLEIELRDTRCFQFVHCSHHGRGRATQAINGPEQGDVEAAALGVLEEAIESWTLVSAFRARDPSVLIGGNDIPASQLCQLREVCSLVLNRLAIC